MTRTVEFVISGDDKLHCVSCEQRVEGTKLLDPQVRLRVCTAIARNGSRATQ